MSLRVRLVLAFVGLAVLPLLGVTLYSYFASARALRQAARVEVRDMTEDLGRRMDEVAAELTARVDRMRKRVPTGGDKSPFAQARRDALAAAEQAELRPVLETVLALTERRQDEVPFAIDARGQIYAAAKEDVRTLEAMKVRLLADASRGGGVSDDWIVVARPASSGITLGIARPVGESLRAMWRAAAWNLGLGLGMVALAFLGTLPLSRSMTRNLAALTEGARGLARGNLDTRVEVRSNDEFGRLAATFNRMAEELAALQDRRVEQERLHKELELCRRIQEELLPTASLRFPFGEAEGLSIPAREVGGDFFNYFPVHAQQAAIWVGDVSGKGVAAALLMANLQATLSARLPLEADLVRLAERLDVELDRGTPSALYLTLFVALVDGGSGLVRYVNAGHNPPVVVRSDGAVEALPPTGRPLGLFSGGGYDEGRILLRPGDALFLYTDGLVEAEDSHGEAYGAQKLESLLVGARASSATGLLARVEESLQRHRGAEEAADDATMVLFRLGSLVA